ncbi:hypothetical protein OXB_0102 [Bacillus sp. OxB-1]|uniref:hypothetical protein n=1 Tax=Bacillus sp. (strain OxB-1) TaxID=98228 RepID=UPI000581C5F9|nr:hypothetical protein [Bacillus sp. OxB-1]BAQ08574.1 hypothetical protein OXB_0102 [Bacillus sp. OxB-1]
MYKVAVVGPDQSVNRILTLAKEIEKELEFVPYIYHQTAEVKDFVVNPKTPVDFWLFSGYIPYQIAVNTVGPNESFVHIDSSELSIYKGILKLSADSGQMLERISVDLIDSYFYEKDLLPLEQSVKKLYRKTFNVDIQAEALFEFHYELWQQDKIDAAFTCYPKVYEDLQQAGVPAFWLSPTRHEIVHTIRMFFEKIKTSYYKDTQISVVIMEILAYDAIKEKMKESYQLDYLELDLKKTLIQLCERLDGSLFEQGNGRYAIFSTRGAVEQDIRSLKEKVNYLSVEADSRVAVGIGFGQTVFTAETNAYRAIRESKGKEEQEIVIVQEDGTMIDAAGDEGELTYSYRTDDKEFLERLNEGHISVKTFKRIESLIRKMDWNTFTTKDLAIHLKMSERNAQRIVSDLCKVNIAECVGEESHYSRGRPVKVYQLSW